MPANFLQCSSHRPVLFFASFLRRYEVASIAESLRAFTSGHFQAQAADATYLGGSGQPVVSEVLQSPGWGGALHEKLLGWRLRFLPLMPNWLCRVICVCSLSFGRSDGTTADITT